MGILRVRVVNGVESGRDRIQVAKLRETGYRLMAGNIHILDTVDATKKAIR